MMADPFDLSADAGKLIKLQARQEAQGLHVVKENDGASDSNSTTD